MDAGYCFTLDETSKAAGQIILTVKFPLNGVDHPLTVVFPDFYPQLPFEIFGKSLPPGRHICPNSGLLCLIQNPQTSWQIGDTLAKMLSKQVNDIINAHLDPLEADEAKEGTQRSGQYSYTLDSILLTQNWDIPAQHSYGKLLIGLESRLVAGQPIRGAVIEVQDSDGKLIAKLDETLANRYREKIRGRWVRLTNPPDFSGVDPLADAIKVAPSLAHPKFDGGPDIIGMLFPEESGYKVIVENWIFTVRTKYKEKNGKASYPMELTRSDCFDRENMMARVHSLSPLSSKKVLIVGVGAIGSMVAWQLARAGVKKMILLDQDFVQVGNIPRWLLGIHAVGKSKARAVADFLTLNYPFISLMWACHKIGSIGDFKILRSVFEEVDLVIDATAEWGVNRLLSDLCKAESISYLWATGTHGSRGGSVGRVVPNKTKGCWKCYQHHMNDGSIVTPAADNLPDIQPKGCFHPTFTGTGFDMDHVSLEASRLAVATLCSNQANSYTDMCWDVAILNLWSNNNTPIAPQWLSYSLERHPNCPEHD